MKNLLCYILVISFGLSVYSQEYTPNDESLKNYEAPEWYEDAKLGFWPIWGVFSVPAYMGDHAAEWYGRWMYVKNNPANKYHIENYGDPAKFGYKDLIPLWKAENFDADKWIDICQKGGAKFFTTLAIFHDSFALWDSKYQKWNSVNMGPKKDIVKELGIAARKRGMKYGVSNHSAWNARFFMYNKKNKYDAMDKANDDLYGTPEFVENYEKSKSSKGVAWTYDAVKLKQRDIDAWLNRTKELVDVAQPDLYYFDWCISPKEFEEPRKEFASYYYNKSIEFGKGTYGKPNVVLNYKAKAFPDGAAVRDFERGGMKNIAPMVWQTDDSIYDGHNWGYADGVKIKPTNTIVDQLCDVVSKRGVLMLAIAPKADGTIPADQEKFLNELGAWLKICGEAIYKTRPYKVFGEVSKSWNTRLSNDNWRISMKATNEDIRFTRTKDNKKLYAILLDWKDGQLRIKSLADLDKNSINNIKLIGVNKALDWSLESDALVINMPKKPNYDFAYPICISFK